MSPSVAVELIGTGAHRKVQVTVPAAADVCPDRTTHTHGHEKVELSLNLPPALMVDPYELESALSSDIAVHLQGNLDLESPEVVSGWTMVAAVVPLQAKGSTLMLPVDSKYGIPSTNAQDTSGQRLITIPDPTAEVQCAEKMHDSGEGVPQGPSWIGVQSQHGLGWVLPVSNTSSILLVGAVTQLVQVLCTLSVVLVCWRRWLGSRHKLRGLKQE